jgi:hypothetical protein
VEEMATSLLHQTDAALTMADRLDGGVPVAERLQFLQASVVQGNWGTFTNHASHVPLVECGPWVIPSSVRV